MQLDELVPFYSNEFGKLAKKSTSKKKSGQTKAAGHKKGAHQKAGHQKPDQMQAGHGTHQGHGSTRTDQYKGFEVEIETTYQFTVNGKPLNVHAHVLNSGHLHCPDMPNYGWSSAVDFVREMIDSFPDDFAEFAQKHGKHASVKSSKKKKKKTRKKTNTSSKKSTAKKSKTKRASKKIVTKAKKKKATKPVSQKTVAKKKSAKKKSAKSTRTKTTRKKRGK